MNNSYLIQRLLRPYKKESTMSKLGNAFAFGGGLVNGGLSDKAMDILNDIFAFDYMGAAEFEFGAVPKALSNLFEWAQNGNIATFSMLVTYKYHDWKTDKTITGTKPVWVICSKEHELAVVNRIKSMAIGKNERTKERIGLDSALGGEEYSQKLIGWLELDNGYMFFSEAEPYNKMCASLGVVTK